MSAVSVAIRVGWPAIVCAVIFVIFGRYGFNPTDEGFINAIAYRLLQGQVPHRDFILPRPVGSGYLHAPELLLPLPGLLASRFVALVQITAYSILLAFLILRRPPWRWSAPEIGLGAASVLINLNTMPLMVWPTIDGILLVAAGVVLLHRGLERERLSFVVIAFVLIGAATTMKQSFWPAPFVAGLWLIASAPGARRLTWLAAAVCSAGITPAAYLGIVALGGGLDAMIGQFTSVPATLGAELFELVPNPAATAALAGAIAVLQLVSPPAMAPHLVRVAPVAIAAVAVGGVVAILGFEEVDPLAITLWWILCAQVIARSLQDRRPDWPGLMLLALGWMVSLSYGIPSPALVAGSMGLYVVLRTLPDAGNTEKSDELSLDALRVGALILVVAWTPTFVSGRLTYTYRDRPAEQLTASLSAVDDDFRGIRTNPVTAEYMAQLVDCIAAHPAEQVAVLPDNPVIYPALELSNPFPMDWILPLDIINSEYRLIEAAAALNDRGGYLVLFQPVGAHRLARMDVLERSSSGPFRDPALGALIRAELTGTTVKCGQFDGVWAP